MRILAIIKRVLREMIRDKRTLALMFVAPIFILSLMYFLFQSNNNQTATLGVRNIDSVLVTAVKNDHLKIHKITSTSSAKKVIRQKDYAGVLSQSGDKLTLTLQNSDQSKSAIIKQSLQAAQIKLRGEAAATAIKAQQKAIKKLSTALTTIVKQTRMPIKAPAMSKPKTASVNYSLKTHYLYGNINSTFFDTLLPIMIGFVVFFFVFLISGIALLRERTTGTLYRLLATPVKKGEIITGYLAGYGIFALIQTFIIVAFTMYAFKIQILGNLWNVFIINILMAIVALTMGLFISSFASSEFQMVQFIPLVVIPQIFFSGIIPIDQIVSWLRPVANIMPLYYGATAMSNVIEKGFTFTQILPQLGILVLFALLFLFLNTVSMNKYRQV